MCSVEGLRVTDRSDIRIENFAISDDADGSCRITPPVSCAARRICRSSVASLPNSPAMSEPRARTTELVTVPISTIASVTFFRRQCEPIAQDEPSVRVRTRHLDRSPAAHRR